MTRRTDAEVIDAWTERASVIEFDGGQPRSVAEELAASEFVGREAAVVAIYRAKLKAQLDKLQGGLF